MKYTFSLLTTASVRYVLFCLRYKINYLNIYHVSISNTTLLLRVFLFSEYKMAAAQ